MYSIFNVDIRAWRNRLLQAEPRLPLPLYQPHWWRSQPLMAPLPHMTFAVSAKAPMLDNYWTGSIFDLYSTRLIAALCDAGVQYETFSATIVDRKMGAELPVHYEVFHLLEQEPALDMDRSDIDVGVVRKLVVSSTKLQHQRPFFRVAELRNIVMIRDDIRAAFDALGITGCRYVPIDEYQTFSLTG